MNISQEYLERCAADSGFQIGPLEKVTRLGELASHIARHPVLGKSLVLKGGTAPIPSIFESIFSLFDRENLPHALAPQKSHTRLFQFLLCPFLFPTILER